VNGADAVLRELREQVSATDREILDLVNRRLGLVAKIKARKDELGVAFLDPQREESMLRELEQANGGPLTPEGLRELQAELLALTKREVERR
jgi:chorismate mutase / prephenate dehydratase